MYDYERRAHTDEIENLKAVPEVLQALDKLLGSFKTHFGVGPENKRSLLERFTKRLRAGKATKKDVWEAAAAIDSVVAYLKDNRMMGGADRDIAKFRALKRLMVQLQAFDPNA